MAWPHKDIIIIIIINHETYGTYDVISHNYNNIAEKGRR